MCIILIYIRYIYFIYILVRLGLAAGREVSIKAARFSSLRIKRIIFTVHWMG